MFYSENTQKIYSEKTLQRNFGILPEQIFDEFLNNINIYRAIKTRPYQSEFDDNDVYYPPKNRFEYNADYTWSYDIEENVYKQEWYYTKKTGLDLTGGVDTATTVVLNEVEKRLIEAKTWQLVVDSDTELNDYISSIKGITLDRPNYPLQYAYQLIHSPEVYQQEDLWPSKPNFTKLFEKASLSLNAFVQEFSGTYYGDPSGTNDSDYLLKFDSDNTIGDSEFYSSQINYEASLPINTNIQVTGYFLASYSGSHTFTTISDDFSYLWIGENAVTGKWNIDNAVVNNGGLHGADSESGVVNLVADKFYPFRIVFGNNSGPGTFRVEYEHAGQSKTSDFSGRLYHNQNSDSKHSGI